MKCVSCGTETVEDAWSLRCRPCFQAEFGSPPVDPAPDEPGTCGHGHLPSMDDPECLQCRDLSAWNSAIDAAIGACLAEEDRVRLYYRTDSGALSGLGSEKVAAVASVLLKLQGLRR